MTVAAALALGVDELGLAVPEGTVQLLQRYVTLIAKWNRTFNLTAVREPLRMVTHHILDSLAIIQHLPQGPLADVGAGAGLPGIPIAIAQPSREVALNDASEKKCAFLRQAAIELRLENVQVHGGRVENWHPAQGFRVVVCRGFAELREFLTATEHLLAAGGVAVAMKGRYPADELARLPTGWVCHSVLRLRIGALGAERHLVMCRTAT